MPHHLRQNTHKNNGHPHYASRRFDGWFTWQSAQTEREIPLMETIITNFHVKLLGLRLSFGPPISFSWSASLSVEFVYWKNLFCVNFWSFNEGQNVQRPRKTPGNPRWQGTDMACQSENAQIKGSKTKAPICLEWWSDGVLWLLWLLLVTKWKGVNEGNKREKNTKLMMVYMILNWKNHGFFDISWVWPPSRKQWPSGLLHV